MHENKLKPGEEYRFLSGIYLFEETIIKVGI